MSDLIAVAVVDLKSGPALDWAVAKAIGLEVKLITEFASLADGGQRVSMCCFPVNGRRPYKPSADWAQGGPLIANAESVSFWRFGEVEHCQLGETGIHDGANTKSGSTKLEAFCKAKVAAKFGDAVTVPRELEVTK